MMATTTQTAIELPLRLQPGEIQFYIELGLIDDVPGLYALLKTMNIVPQLAYQRTQQGVEILLLLAHDHREVLESAPDEYYWQEQQILSNAINTEAMHCRFRRTTERTAIAA